MTNTIEWVPLDNCVRFRVWVYVSVEGLFYTLDTCLDIIKQVLECVFAKKEVELDAFVEWSPESHFATINLCTNIKSKVQGAILQNGLGLLSTSYQQSGCSPLFAKGTLLWCVTRPTPQCAKGTLFYPMRLSLQKGLFSTIFRRNITLLWNETSFTVYRENITLCKTRLSS